MPWLIAPPWRPSQLSGSDEISCRYDRFYTYLLGYSFPVARKSAFADWRSRAHTIQGTWTNPSIGSHVKPKLCSMAISAALERGYQVALGPHWRSHTWRTVSGGAKQAIQLKGTNARIWSLTAHASCVSSCKIESSVLKSELEAYKAHLRPWSMRLARVSWPLSW